jgi:MFS family permease
VSVALPAAAARTSLLDPLRGRDFRLLWSGTILSLLGDGLTRVALTWLVLQLTGSPLATGGVLAAAAIPSGVLGLLGGAAADRFGARRIGVLTTLVRCGGMGLLAALVLSHTVLLVEIYALAIAFGAADAFYGPSRASLIPRTVPDEQLEAANGLEGTANSLLMLIGPALGGLLVAKAGSGYAFLADAVLMAVVVLLTARLRAGEAIAADGGQPTTLLGDVAAGLRYAFSDPVLRTLIVLVTAMTFAINGPESVGFAALARIRWGGPISLGLTLGAFGAGSLVGSLLAGMLPPGRVLLKLVGVGVVFSAGLALIGFAPNVGVAMALTAGMGVAGGLINVIGGSWLMRRTAPAMMARLMSLMMVTSVGAAPLSLAVAGAIAQYNVTWMFVGAGALMLTASLAALASRTVRESGSPE